MRHSISLQSVNSPLTSSLLEEKNRYTSKGPLKALLSMTTGPCLLMLGSTFHSWMELFLISKAYKGNSIFIVGAASFLKLIVSTFPICLGQGLTGKISGLIAEDNSDEAFKVISDMFRITFAIMIIVCFGMLAIGKELMLFMSCPTQDLEIAYQYLIPTLVCYPFATFFQMCCGIIQAQGRSFLSGMLQIGGFALNIGIFAPILYFLIKVPFPLSSLSFGLSQAFPSVILFSLLFSGGLKFQMNFCMLFKKFSSETKSAVMMGLPILINILSQTLPQLLLFSYTIKAAVPENLSDIVGSLLSVQRKIYTLVIAIPQSINQGFLACGSFSHGAHMIDHYRKILFYAIFFVILYSGLWTILMVCKADLFVSIWVDDGKVLKFSNSYLRIPYYTQILNAVPCTLR